MIRGAVNEAVSRLRDRRTKLRKNLEEVFDRQTFVTILVLGPFGKSVELLLLGRPETSIKFAALALVGVGCGVYWHRLKEAAGELGDAVEEATEE